MEERQHEGESNRYERYDVHQAHVRDVAFLKNFGNRIDIDGAGCHRLKFRDALFEWWVNGRTDTIRKEHPSQKRRAVNTSPHSGEQAMDVSETSDHRPGIVRQ